METLHDEPGGMTPSESRSGGKDRSNEVEIGSPPQETQVDHEPVPEPSSDELKNVLREVLEKMSEMVSRQVETLV
jgi:hypothetical protein